MKVSECNMAPRVKTDSDWRAYCSGGTLLNVKTGVK